MDPVPLEPSGLGRFYPGGLTAEARRLQEALTAEARRLQEERSQSRGGWKISITAFSLSDEHRFVN